jgi:hypothetical protein
MKLSISAAVPVREDAVRSHLDAKTFAEWLEDQAADDLLSSIEDTMYGHQAFPLVHVKTRKAA